MIDEAKAQRGPEGNAGAAHRRFLLPAQAIQELNQVQLGSALRCSVFLDPKLSANIMAEARLKQVTGHLEKKLSAREALLIKKPDDVVIVSAGIYFSGFQRCNTNSPSSVVRTPLIKSKKGELTLR